jgi:hypothetical protein
MTDGASRNRSSAQGISAEALRATLSQLITEPLPDEVMNTITAYLQKLSSLEATSVVSLDEIYPYIERIVSQSKNDYLQPLLVVQALENLCYSRR